MKVKENILAVEIGPDFFLNIKEKSVWEKCNSMGNEENLIASWTLLTNIETSSVFLYEFAANQVLWEIRQGRMYSIFTQNSAEIRSRKEKYYTCSYERYQCASSYESLITLLLLFVCHNGFFDQCMLCLFLSTVIVQWHFHTLILKNPEKKPNNISSDISTYHTYDINTCYL